MHRLYSFALVIVAALLATPARAQCSEVKLVGADTIQGSQFGQSVALEGTTAVVGASKDPTVVTNGGVAYVFELGAGGWQQSAKLVAPALTVGALFGCSVSISGDWIAVGASGDGVNSLPGSGSVFLYQRQGSGWSAPVKIKASVPKHSALFGCAVSISGDHLMVGAYQDSVGVGSGSVYAFERQGTSWVQTALLAPADAQPADAFGYSVALQHDRALLGAPVKDEPFGGNTGVAYVFERGAGGWAEVAKLVPPPHSEQNAGWSVALLDDKAFLGAIKYDFPIQGMGACFVFQEDGGAWSLGQTLVPNDPEFSMAFGWSLSALGRHLLVGALADKDLGFSSGSAYLFEDFGSSYVQVGKLLGSDTSAGDLCGTSVALWGDVALVGAPRDDDACPTNAGCDSGSVHVFRTSTNSVQFCSCASGAPCGNEDDFGGCANSTGQGAVLSACGDASVALDDLELEARWLPPSNFALLFMGGAWTQVPFGDGRLCVAPGGNGVHRYAVATTSPAGSLHFGPGIAALSQSFPPQGQIQPGDAWYFQIWYRDPSGPCATAVNLTNALRVTFQP